MFAVHGELLLPPPRKVSDETFQAALNDNDVLGVARAILRSFPNISREAQKRSLHKGLWKALKGHDFTRTQKFTTSLHKFVKLACIDEFQAERKEKKHLERFVPSGDFLEGELAPENLFSAEEKEKAWMALHMLSPSTRDVLLAHFGKYGRSIESLASRWKMTTQNAQKRLEKALAQFKRKYHSLE